MRRYSNLGAPIGQKYAIDTEYGRFICQVHRLVVRTPTGGKGVAYKMYCQRESAEKAPTGMEKLRVEAGAVFHPFYCEHRRCRNWIATVTRDIRAPGGLARTFWKHIRREWYEIPRDIRPGQVIEIGSDYYSRSGNLTQSTRRYYIVERITPSAVYVRETKKP
mgnify:CR=1 FL=1